MVLFHGILHNHSRKLHLRNNRTHERSNRTLHHRTSLQQHRRHNPNHIHQQLRTSPNNRRHLRRLRTKQQTILWQPNTIRETKTNPIRLHFKPTNTKRRYSNQSIQQEAKRCVQLLHSPLNEKQYPQYLEC